MIATNKSQRDWVCRLGSALALAIIGISTFALSDTDFQGAISYDFRPPGARSLAMGGAFTAIADDATSALLNPAGLVQLRRPEFSLVGKVWTEDMHLDWGSGSYTDLSYINPNFPTENRVERDFYNTRGAPAFVSFVYSFKRVTLGVYHAQTMAYSNSFVRDEIATGPVLIEDCSVPPCTTYPDSSSILSTALTQASGSISHTRDLGLAAAFDLGHKFSLGLTGYLGHLKFQARSTRYTQGSFVSGQNATLIVNEYSDEHAFGWGAGLLYAGDAWRFGFGWQKGESYSVRVTPQKGPRGSNILRRPFDTPLRVPDRATLAVAWRPSPLVTLSAELEHIGWSKLLDNFHSFQPNVSDPSGNFEAPFTPDSGFKIDDALNPHLGFEYVLLADTSPLSLRAGAWWEHGHRLRYVGHFADIRIPTGPTTTIIFEGQSLDNAQKIMQPGGGSQQHFTAGIGFVAGKIQFDAGYDYAKWSRQFAASAILRF